jgi:hypothetical protein
VSPERHALQMPGDLSATRIQARASFLRSIICLRPRVVAALWHTAFPEFKRIVLLRFSHEIFGGLDPQSYIKEKHEQYLADPKRVGDYFVDLIQQKLAQDESLPGLQGDLVRQAFFDYVTVTGSPKNKSLITLIDDWSRRWNLDEDWCRDHALAVLREWLFDRELKWVGLLRSCQALHIQQRGWLSVAGELETEAPFSAILVDLDLESDSEIPEPLSFSPPKNPNFRFQSCWNIATESEIEFKRRVRLEFRMALSEAERSRLQNLQQDRDFLRTATARVFERGLTETSLSGSNGLFESFERHLQDYVVTINSWRTKTKLKYRLDEGVRPPRDEHLRWLILCRVPDKDGTCFTYSELVAATACLDTEEGRALTAEAARKSITAAANQISLKTKNPHSHRGRPRGTGKPIAFRASR